MQGSFDDVVPGLFAAGAVDRGDAGYRAPAVVTIAGITYRQLDYWARSGLITPSVQSATGSGSQRLYSFRDILAVKIIKRLLDAGISLGNIRAAIDYLRERDSTVDLARVTLVCDGISVYECTTDDEVIDLLAGGQGVFGIAVGATVTELADTIAAFPAETATTGHSESGVAVYAGDELARRRGSRKSA